MKELIAVSEIIEILRSKNVNLGKGDPYNRLRYYTKIGWLPHMIRKVGPSGAVEGHYPSWVIERLEYIEKLKSEGFQNDDITEKIKTENVKVNFKSLFSFINTPSKRNQILSYLSFVFVFVILLSELGVISGGDIKQRLDDIASTNSIVENSIIASGSGLFPSGEKMIFVKSPMVTTTSKINVTFLDDYLPATRYWVRSIVPFEGFYIELDTLISQNTSFNWWVSN